MGREELTIKISEAINEGMAQLRITPKMIHERTGWGYPYISRVRNGRHSCFSRIDQWAAVLNMTPSNLLKQALENE